MRITQAVRVCQSSYTRSKCASCFICLASSLNSMSMKVLRSRVRRWLTLFADIVSPTHRNLHLAFIFITFKT